LGGELNIFKQYELEQDQENLETQTENHGVAGSIPALAPYAFIPRYLGQG
jgi:hypothetical protein